MKALLIESFGGTEVLKFSNLPIPTILDHEALIEIHAAGVNPVDWKIREGHLKDHLPHEFPIILGWDVAGIIKAVGKNVTDLKIGDEVFAYCRKPIVKNGTYAEYIAFDAMHIAKLPKTISFSEAAGVPLAALTAWQALFDFCNLQKNQSVLIHAGAGGVGSFAIQFAKMMNATVYTTCSSENYDYVKSLGADYPIDYKREKFFDVIKEKLDVVLDTIGGEVFQKSLSLVKPKGHLISIVQSIDPKISEKHDIDARYLFVRPSGMQLRKIAELIEEGQIKIPSITEFEFSHAVDALKESQSGHTRGKLVLKVK